MNIAGVLLAGGQSSRYGQPKMFAAFAGRPLYKYSLTALQQQPLDPIIIATNAHLQPYFAEENVHWLMDKQPHQGPLFALHTILTAYPEVEWFFVVACDMPCMNARFVQQMLGYIDEQYDAIVPQQGERYQPLAALYRRTALAKIMPLIQQKKRNMRALLEQLRVCYVPFAEHESTFININAQQDWAQIINKESNHD
ncbi:molybdenum cofactor guanylyltransferase [Lysinibacillus sp. FSL K6-0232]|uniref:molybdenum cofactor guanylyltransferase n=1 Tax=unclassified Lysinibacillus TaxID=2636778 RepID=UPI0030FA5D8D